VCARVRVRVRVRACVHTCVYMRVRKCVTVVLCVYVLYFDFLHLWAKMLVSIFSCVCECG